MKISVKIEFANPKQANQALALIAGLDCPASFETEAAPLVKDETEEAPAPVEEKPKTKSTGRPKKAKVEETTPEESPVIEAPAEEKSVISASEIRREMAEKAEPAITIDEAREALKAYALINGVDKAKDIVAAYGVSKISDVPADKLAELVGKLK